jgi:hypothetical protein
MFIWRVWREYIIYTLSYVFSSNSSYKHVLCIFFQLFLHINLTYVFSSYIMSYVFSLYKHVLCTLFKFIWRIWKECIRHVYVKSLKRIHRTCLYEEFEENTLDMFIWRVWREYVFSSNSSYKHVLCILFKFFI